jgi:hypothetical protein
MLDRTTFAKLIGWQTAAATSQQYQQFKFTYTGQTLKLDVAAGTTTVLPPVKVYVGSQFLKSDQYSYTVNTNSTTITLNQTYLPTDVIEVLVLSDQTSSVAFYQVPINLQNNPLNGNSPVLPWAPFVLSMKVFVKTCHSCRDQFQVPTTVET